MIEPVAINGREVDLSLNAEQFTEETSLGLLTILRHKRETGLNYHAISENVLLLDEDMGISLAAQMLTWRNNQEIGEGDLNIYVPFDNTIYRAHIEIHKEFINVTREELLKFEKALEEINKEALNYYCHDGGKLTQGLREHNCDITDLGFNFADNRHNPFRLVKRTRTESALSVLTVAIILGVLGYGGKVLFEKEDIRTAITPISDTPEPVAVNVHYSSPEQLRALAEKLSTLAVWLAYQLRTVQIVMTNENWTVGINGEYRAHYNLDRMVVLANQMGGEFTMNGPSWVVTNIVWPITQPDPGSDPVPIYDQYDNLEASLKVIPMKSHLGHFSPAAPGYVETRIDITINNPNAETLLNTARLMEKHNIPGQITTLQLLSSTETAWDSATFQLAFRASSNGAPVH